MDWLTAVWTFIRDDPERFNRLLLSHLRISLAALGLAMLIHIPLGVLFARSQRFGSSAVGLVSAFRVIPSLALIFVFVPVLGFGYRPALFALVILAAPPLILNTFAGLVNVDRSTIEAAHGLGMNNAHVFFKVQLPLALPVILAGVRSASVEIFASATLASLIGVITLGQLIFTGISLLDTTYLLAGGIPIVLIVLAAQLILGGLERLVSPPASS